MHNWDWAIHKRGAPRPQAARSRMALAAVRGSPAAAGAPPRRGTPGLRFHIAGRAQPARWPAARHPGAAVGLADRKVDYRRRRRPTADNPAEADTPEADRPEEAGSTAPTPPHPTLQGRSVAPRWHSRAENHSPSPSRNRGSI